jgi:hypothetical protein
MEYNFTSFVHLRVMSSMSNSRGQGEQPIEEDLSKIDALVLRLMQQYLNKGHHLFMDNDYNNKLIIIHCAAKLTHNFKSRVFEPNLFPVTTFRNVKY